MAIVMAMEVSAEVFYLATTMRRLDKLVCSELGLPPVSVVIKESFRKYPNSGTLENVPASYETVIKYKKDIIETTWFGLITTKKTKITMMRFRSESFYIYQAAVDKVSLSTTTQVSWAAHEVRHRLQTHRQEKISFGFWQKLKKSWMMSRFVNVSLFSYLIRLVYCYCLHPHRKSDTGGEPDAYFITYLALADYENNSDLNRIAKIIQI